MTPRDPDNRKTTWQFLILPLVLGGLLLANGLIGIDAAKRASSQLGHLNDTALGPTLAFGEITANLNLLSKNLLRLNQQGLGAEGERELLEKSEGVLKKISKQVKRQVDASQGQAYGDYLKNWVNDWDAFQADTALKLRSIEEARPELRRKDEAISGLIEKMNNVSAFIQADVQDMVDQSAKFSRKTSWTLICTLILGGLIGLVSSIFVVRSIRNLFRIIAKGKQNIETLLNNLDQGFLVFDRAGNVQNEVSRAARDFFGTELAGRPFQEVLPGDRKMKDDARGWLDLIFGDALTFDDFKPVAPHSFETSGRYIELDFRPISAEGAARLDKVICIASDKTEERALREKAEAEAALVKIVMKVLSDRGSFVDFVLDTRRIVAELKRELAAPAPNLETLNRGMHSLKGGAAAYHFMRVSRDAHQFETVLSEMLVEGGERLPGYLPELRAGLAGIEQRFESFLRDHEFIFGHIGDHEDRTRTVPVSTVYDLCQLIFRQIGKQSPIFSEFVEKFVQEDLGNSFRRYESVVQGIAERQMKKVTLEIEQGKARVYVDPYLSLVSSFIHVFRNAIDHGIEDEVTRGELGKPEAGRIRVSFEKLHDSSGDNHRLRILVRDDGKGIDPEAIRAQAVHKGLVPEEKARMLSRPELYQILFQNGFSTRDQVSELSGRGVGLDAVKYEAGKLGGTAWIESEAGQGVSLYVEVPLYDFPNLVHVPIERNRAA